jgi:hypothetical protein
MRAERKRAVVEGCDGEADCCLRLIVAGAQPPDKALTGPVALGAIRRLTALIGWQLLGAFSKASTGMNAHSKPEGVHVKALKALPGKISHLSPVPAPVTVPGLSTPCFLQREQRGYFWPQCPGPIAS